MDEELEPFFDALIRQASSKNIVRLAAALAKRTLGEDNFAQELVLTKQLFDDRIAGLSRTEDTNQSNAEEFMRDKRYELRQWLIFLNHRYKGAKASSEIRDHRLNAFRLPCKSSPAR